MKKIVENSAWEPLPGSQTTVLAHRDVFELLYHGTRGPGKSITLLMDFLQDVGTGLGASWRGVMFRQTYKQLGDLVAKSKEVFPKIIPGAKFLASQSDYKWVFPTGEELLFRQFNRDDDYLDYHGQQFPWIGWDELTNYATSVGYKRMMSCCRSANPKVMARVRSATNPYGPGHNWVKFHFKLPMKDGIRRKRQFLFEDPSTGKKREEWLTTLTIKGTIYENTILLDAQPTYIAQIRDAARNPAELEAWLDGSWDIVAGGMFDDVWVEKYNLVPPFPIPPSWKLDRSFDWGSSSPFSVGWWAESDGSDYLDGNGQVRASVRGDLFRIDEWYGWNGQPNEGLKMLATDIAKGIIEREHERWPGLTFRAGPADTQIYQVVNGVCIAQDMSDSIRLSNGQIYPGPAWVQADKSPGSRKTGWEMVRKMIRNAHPNENTPREKPGLFVFSNCEQFRRTVPTLPRSDKDMDDIPKEGLEDHIADETRYRVRTVGTRVRSGTTTGMF